MADNYINVSVTSRQNQKVTVSTPPTNAEVTATTDTGKFWAQTAERWATSDTLVENKDYSSKYYANKAKTSAENAKVYEAAVKNTYNNFTEASSVAITDIQNTSTEAISNIENVKSDSLKEVQAKGDKVIADINNAENSSVSNITQEGNKQISNIKSTGFYMENDKLYFTNSKGEKEEFKNGIDSETLEQIVLKDSLHKVQVITETYVNGTSWYRVWSDGWCEQGGELSWSNNTVTTITFIKTFKDINYNIYSQVFGPYQNANLSVSFSDKTTSSIKMYPYSDSRIINWQASGYLY